MSLRALLAAEAYKTGRAVRSTLFRHRAIEDDPIYLVAWSNGFDPFACTAIAFGQGHAPPELFVMSGTRDRDLELREFAAAASRFCELFDAYGMASSQIEHHGRKLDVPVWLPQIVIPNRATLGLLGRMGRRFIGIEHPDAALQGVLRRFAAHLLWLVRHADLPGQQVTLPCTEFLNAHWVSAMSALECQSLFALEAWIDPPARTRGFEAAVLAERFSAGPQPKPEDAQSIARLYGALEAARKGAPEEDAEVCEALGAIRHFFSELTAPVWALLLGIVRREREVKGAQHLARRIECDRIAYGVHQERLDKKLADPRGYRFLEGVRGAAMRRDELERAGALLAVEEAIDDPLKMLPLVLAGAAIEGHVHAVRRHKEEGTTVELLTEEPCALPPGLELWWSGAAFGRGWAIERVEPAGPGSRVLLSHPLCKDPEACPVSGARAVFSPLFFDDFLSYGLVLPTRAPWTHRPAA